MVEQGPGEDPQRMAREYDPTWEMETVLLKTRARTSVYRVGVLLQLSRRKGSTNCARLRAGRQKGSEAIRDPNEEAHVLNN